MHPRPCSVCPQVGWEMCFVPLCPRGTSVLLSEVSASFQLCGRVRVCAPVRARSEPGRGGGRRPESNVSGG